jgi:hypothetical protein
MGGNSYGTVLHLTTVHSRAHFHEEHPPKRPLDAGHRYEMEDLVRLGSNFQEIF